MAGQLDFGKVPLADGLEQTVVADVWLLVGAGGDGVPAASPQRATGLARGLVCTAGPQQYMLPGNKTRRVLETSVCVGMTGDAQFTNKTNIQPSLHFIVK